MKLNYAILLLITFTLLSSCYEDNFEDLETTVVVDKPRINVDASLIGRVTNEFGDDTEIDFLAKLNNDTYQSGQSPIYLLSGTDINKVATVVNLETDDTDFEFTIKPIENDINYFNHTVFSNKLIHEWTAGSDQSINLDTQSKLFYKTGSTLQAGQNFTGTIRSEAFIIDTENVHHRRGLPGGQLGYNLNGSPGILDIHYGIEISLEDDQNLPLEFVSGGLILEVDGVDCVDCEIYQYENGIWMQVSEEGIDVGIEITKGGYYIIARQEAFVSLSGQLVNGNQALHNTEIEFRTADHLITSYFTSSSGKWYVHVPVNTSIEMSIPSGCNQIYTKTFEIDEEDLDAGVVALTMEEAGITYVNGSVRNCEDELTSTHFIRVESGQGKRVYFIEDNPFTIPVLACANDKIFIQTANESWNQVGPEIEWTASDQLDIYSSYACNMAKSEYLTIRIEDKEYITFVPEVTLTSNDRTLIQAENRIGFDLSFRLWFSGSEVGSYSDTDINIDFTLLNEVQGFELGCGNSSEGCGFESFVVTHYGESGEWIRGYFEGKFWIKKSNPLQAANRRIEGEFQVFRGF